MQWDTYGQQRTMPDDIDFYTLSNEDIGFTAALVSGTNNVYSFALPYPSGIDLHESTIEVYAIDFMYNSQSRPDAGGTAKADALYIWLSMLDKEFRAAWSGDLSDTEDSELKAQFDGPIYIGQTEVYDTDVAEGFFRQGLVRSTRYFPPNKKMDLITPLYIQFLRQSYTYSSTTAPSPSDFGDFELISLRVWFTPRKLTGSEKNARNNQLRWQLLDA